MLATISRASRRPKTRRRKGSAEKGKPALFLVHRSDASLYVAVTS